MPILAINGGNKVRQKNFPAYNVIGKEEERAVMEVFASGTFSRFLGCWHEDFFGGPQVLALEKEWAGYFGAKHAIAVNSATSGLYCAVGAIGTEPGDEIIVSPYTMSASAVAHLVYGAFPVFADAEAEYVFLGENEKKHQLELFDIEQKRKLLILEKKMNKEQANEFAQSEKKRALEDYQIAQSQRTFEFGWKKAFASYTDNATNAAKLGEQAFVSVTQNLETALDRFVQTGKLSFSDLARSIISDLIKIQLKAQATSLFSSLGIGDFFSGIFGGGKGGTSIPIKFANGGDPPVGVASIVGERGPELFVPKTAGTIIPNHQLGSSMGGGASIVYNGPYIQNMSAIDTQSGIQFLSKNKETIWSANQSAQRSLPQGR